MAEHSVWNSPPATEVSSFNDSPTGWVWAGAVFYTYGEPVYEGWTIAGARLRVEAGSPLIGESVEFGIAQAPVGWGPTIWELSAESTLVQVETNSEAGGVLAAGWNDFRFAVPYPLNFGDSFVIGVRIVDAGQSYVHVGAGGIGDPSSALAAEDGTRLALSEHNFASGFARSLFLYNTGDDNWSSAWFGIDVLLEDDGGGGMADPNTYRLLTNADLELQYLTSVEGADGPTLDDARSQVYVPNQHAYFASLSGLTPASDYSLADHQLAYYRSQTGVDDESLADTARIFWGNELFA